MENEQSNGEYRASDANALVGELFSGSVSVGDAIERLRSRLLDLSARNSLLSYRHPKGRCIQVVDEPNINLVFDRLYADGKGVPFKYVPEPPLDTYEGKRPEARLYADSVGISTSFEFPPNPASSTGRRLNGIQTLLYPADLERQLRKISSEAKTAVEETGSNMLFLIFGFLEFYDSEESERPMLAPLLSLPATLARGVMDRETGTYQYTVQHNGEDLAENHTLREKLRRDFMLSIPEFGEEDEPETYFAQIEQAVKNRRRWKVRRQLTLGMLSFGKLAIWADLDTKRNPGLTENDLIKSVFSGGAGSGDGGFHAEDYRIDELPNAAQPFIYDTDSSQHSAIIDVLSGKNLVINGPPGTGKSQTITNIIAAALATGQKVLFVSEKLAALEVVRHRLNQAGLGHFCLELHSHKTQKKKFLEDIQARIEAHFPAPGKLQAKLTTLQRQKVELARYAELMGSRVGNSLGLTINEVFWAAERRRQELGDLSAEVNTVGVPDASKWTHDDIESRRSRLAGLATLYDEVKPFDSDHPWWGFRPAPLVPSDDETIGKTILQALEHARSADTAAKEAMLYWGLNEQPDAASAEKTREILEQTPPIPDGANLSLLARMFDVESDPKGQYSAQLLSDVVTHVTSARQLFESAARILVDGERLPSERVEEVRKVAEVRQLSPTLLAADIRAALKTVARLDEALKSFKVAVRTVAPPYGPAGKAELGAFIARCEKLQTLGCAPFTARSIMGRAVKVLDTVKDLFQALARVDAIVQRHNLPFDATPGSVARLAASDGLSGLVKGATVDAAVMTEARRLAALPLADKSVTELRRLKTLLAEETSSYSDALARCRLAVERLGIPFDSTERSVAEAAILAKVAATAPSDLLEYRRRTFGNARAAELIERTRAALAVERDSRASFDNIFYLDALPAVSELKSAVVVLRRKEGFFALFDGDWRKARKLHAGLCKEKRKLSGKQQAEELARLASWIEAQQSFVSDPEFKEYFGGLFRGLETDHEKISRLNDWYLASKTAMAQSPGLMEKVDLSAVPSGRISELAAKFDAIRADTSKLAGAEAAVQSMLGTGEAGFRAAKARGWTAGLESLRMVVESLGMVTDFFASRADSYLSPKQALRLMEARAELGASPDLNLLMQGTKELRTSGGEELGCLADLAGGRWPDVLPAVAAQASLAAEAASQARSFAGEDTPLATAEAFAKAKLELDAAWSLVVPLPVWSRFDSWAVLADATLDDLLVSRSILERIAPFAKSGASARDFFAAEAEESEAQSTLDALADSDEICRMLGDVLQGADTNLDCLLQTHGWGKAVCVLDLPITVRKRLLTDDARDSLDTAKRLYGRVGLGCSKAREIVESLASYGSLSWDEWQKQFRGYSGRDLPSEILARLEAASMAQGSLLPWSKYLALRKQALQAGLTEFVSILESKRIPAAALSAAFELATYQAIGRSIYKDFSELSQFNGVAHDKICSDYRSLDAEIISLAGKDFANQIQRCTRVPEGARGVTVSDYTEMHLLRREINKQRRHIPIRQLVKRAGNALQALKPCFMMGPLSVAQYLEQGALTFDLVVMDEASQLRPEEALGAIARGSQVVVVGDPKQLPPTNFFDRMLDSGEDEDEAPAAISGMESILDVCQQLFTPVRSLRWHYRSHHESLIAFSNHHFYKNLIVFPSPYAKNSGLGVKYRYVGGGTYKDRQNVPEALRVVDAVLEHMIKRPEESLGVVTLNQTQRELIEELLDKKLKTFEEGAGFIDHWESEGWPFFIKNLENVQGDERDVIFISTTFGKASGTDKVRQNFGPISRPDGWRRLNVLFTRAKRRIELFTSMMPEDIIADERTPLGTKALRDYLDFAKRGVLVTTDEGEREPDSDFEVSVANVITALGYEVKPQLGVAGFFIDMAVRNPDRRGEFLAGIECDGATYHSGASVRDRDRIRQEILESLGWRGRIYRIWSTDWFYNPRRETEKLKSFLEERRRLSLTEASGEWEEEFDEPTENEIEEKVAEGAAEALPVADDDLFVEVGDWVTYYFLDDPNNRHTILIVDSPSNTKMGLVNEKAPLAHALLGLSPGDIGELEISGKESRKMCVQKVQRQEDLLG